MFSQVLKIAFSVAGSIIGAGFATGKELQLFFPLPDSRSLFYLSFSLGIMAIISVLYFSMQKKSVPNRFQKGFELFFFLFSGASCLVMFACGGETLKESFHLPLIVGNTVTYGLTLWIVSKGIKSVYRFNLIATPVLIVCIILISLSGFSIPAGMFGEETQPTLNMLVYTGYNLLSALPFLSAISGNTEEKHGFFGILVGYFLVLVCGLLLKSLLNLHHEAVLTAPLPLVKIVGMIHPLLSYLYTAMLYLSVLTTAVNSLYAVTRGKHTFSIGSVLLVFSFLGFTSLLESLYPVFGYFGIGIIILVIWDAYFDKSIRERKNL